MSQLLKKPWNHNFLYDETKKVFYQELQCILVTNSLDIIYSSQIIKNIIFHINQGKSHYYNRLGVKCFVANINLREILCCFVCCDGSEEIKQIMTLDEIIDVLAELHMSIFSLPEKIDMHTVPNILIHPSLIMLFLKSCRYCYVYRKATFSTPFKSVCEIGVMRIEPKDEDFKDILIYIDRDSNYVLLRPLKKRQHKEVAFELLNIFCDFGTPTILNVSHRILFNKALNILTNLKLPFDIPSANENHLHKLNKMIKQAKSFLTDWMLRSDCNNWIIGVHIVQWILNTNKVVDTYITSRYVRGVLDCPYHALFARLPHKELVHLKFKNDSKTVLRNRTQKSSAICSYCQQKIYKVYICHLCQAACHIVCCERLLQNETGTPLLVTKCFSCLKQDSISYKCLNDSNNDCGSSE